MFGAASAKRERFRLPSRRRLPQSRAPMKARAKQDMEARPAGAAESGIGPARRWLRISQRYLITVAARWRGCDDDDGFANAFDRRGC